MGRCSHCGKPICAEHSRPGSAGAPPEKNVPGGRPDSGGTVCVGCARRQLVALGEEGQKACQDDPMFWGWTQEDFIWDYTDEDYEAFDTESFPAGAESWEQDWDAS